MFRLLLPVVLISALATVPAAPASVASGSIDVTLRPTEQLAPGASSLVTFGVPFPRDTMTAADLSTVRILSSGKEIPAYVDQLTPWWDTTSVRVARVQLTRAFTGEQKITVAWGGAARAHNVPTLADVRSGWHKVAGAGTTPTGGPTYGDAHNVHEPNVYALLPKTWLAASGLKNGLAPMDDSVAEQRIPPASVSASYPGHLEAEHAMVNFFYTVTNNDDRLTGAQTPLTNTHPFLTDPEPWLYDRAMTMHIGYLRTGYYAFLREAVRNADYYRQKLYKPSDCDNGRCVGSFALKNPNATAGWHDQKYSYNESLATTLWLTGDTETLSHIEDVVKVYKDVANTPAGSFYTERHIALKLMANTIAFEVTGKPEYRTAIDDIVRALRAAQLAPSDGGTVDGGIWHPIGIHEGTQETTPITSPWMSALLVEVLARTWSVTGSAAAADLVLGLADHTCGVGSYMNSHALAGQSGGASLRFPHYFATRDGAGHGEYFNPDEDFEHSYDAATSVMWGAYFAKRAGNTAKMTSLKACGEQLYTTFSHVVTHWTRPAAPANNSDAYRVNPAQKYNWWFKHSSAFPWLASTV